MPSTKRFNTITQKWEVIGSSMASDIAIIDVEGNFEENNLEGCLREIANKSNTNTADVNAIKETVASSSETLNKLNSDFIYHIENHPSGGGGGGGGCTITSTFTGGVVDNDADLYIPIFFTPSIGATTGTIFIMINDIEVGSQIIDRGNNRVHIGKLPSIRNTVSVYARDNKGAMSELLTWDIIRGGIDFELHFDYSADYSIDDVIRCPYTITSPLESQLVLEITVDNVKTEKIVSKQGYDEHIFEGLSVGIHTVHMIVTSGEYRSRAYVFNLVIVSSQNLYISSSFLGGEFEVGVPVIFDYRISKLSTEDFNVKLILDSVLQKTLVVPVGSYTWTIPNLSVGEHTIRVEVRSVTDENVFIERSLTVYAGEYTPQTEVKGGLLASFTSQIMTNDDTEKEIWIDTSGNNVKATLHNFNFKTNGWVEVEVGDGRKERVLRCDNEAYVEIDMKPYIDNVKLGSTIDILYKPKNIGLEDARILDYTDVATPYKGIYANLNQSVLKSATNTGTVFLDEDTETRLTYVIDRTNKFGLIYVNGVINRAFYLSDSGSGVNKFYEDFTHEQKIYLNSEKGIKNFGAVDIKRFRVYGRALSSDEVLQNHLADIEDIQKQKEKYKFNFDNKITPMVKIYVNEESYGNMSDVTSVPCRIKYLSPNEDMFGSSFDLPACDVNWQGTSSLQYVLKNYTIRLKDDNGAEWKYTPYKNGIPESVFCLKCDYMESSHAHNVGMAKFINGCVYDTKTPAQLLNPKRRTTVDGFPILLYINHDPQGRTEYDRLLGAYNFNLDRYSTESYGFRDFPKVLAYEVSANSDTTAGAFFKWTSASGKSEIDYYKSDFEILYPFSRVGNDNYAELIRLVNWVDTASDELFREQIEQYFNLEYLLRYYLTVMVIGAVDNLGKNMKLVTYDGLIWYPQFYDLDTIIGLDNTGFLKFGSDIEVVAGVFNTSGSKLWSKVARVFAVELQQQYALMRLDRFTVNNMMKYLYDEQISAIPERNYNLDMKTKYLDFGSSYLYACHGNREQHIKRWIRERLVYTDTLMKYTSSTSDFITLRSSKLGYVYMDIQTYVPMYLTVKWRDEPDIVEGGQIVNHGKQTKRVGKGETVRFEFNMPTETDQEIVVYAGRYLKSLGDVSNLEPTTMLLANANKLTSIVCHSPNLINTDLSSLKNIQYVDLSDCTALGTGVGAMPTLDMKLCPYIKKMNFFNTKLTAIYTSLDGGSIEEIYYPDTVQAINLANQGRLKIIGIPYGNVNILGNINYTDKYVNGNARPYQREYDFCEVDPTKSYTLKCPTNVTGSASNVYFNIDKYDKDFVKLGGSNQGGLTAHNQSKISLGSFATNVKYIKITLSHSTTKEVFDKSVVALTGEEDIFMECKNLANVDIQNCYSLERLTLYAPVDGQDTFQALKHVQNLTLMNSFKLVDMKFNSFERLSTLSLANMNSLKNIVFDDLKNSQETTNNLKSVTISNCPNVTKLSFNVSDGSHFVDFADNAIIDIGNAYSINTIESNYSIKGLKTIILPTNMKNLVFTQRYGDGINSIENLWSVTSYEGGHSNDGYSGIDFKDMVVETINLEGLSSVPNAINFNIAPTTVNPNLNSRRDGSIAKPWLKPNGTVDLSNYTGNLEGFFKGVDLDILEIICNNTLNQSSLERTFESTSGNNVLECVTAFIRKLNNVNNCNYMLANTPINSISGLNSLFLRNITADYMFYNCPNLTTATITLESNIMSAKGMFAKSGLTTLDGIILLLTSSTAEMFKGCLGLTTDMRLPTQLTDVTSMFEGNTGITSVTSNWRTYFDDDITTSDCYKGCVNISTIDGIYGEIDDIPISWGGYGLSKSVTGSYVLDIPSDNFEVSFTGKSMLIEDGVIYWGDGTVTTGEFTHTYQYAGTYNVRGKVIIGNIYNEPSTSIRQSLIEVKQIPSTISDLTNAFKDCTRLTSVSLAGTTITKLKNTFSGTKLTTIDLTVTDLSNLSTMENAFYGCPSLTSISFKDKVMNKLVSMTYAFYNCGSLKTVDFTNTSLNSLGNLSFAFKNCTQLTNPVGLSKVVFESLSDMSSAFENCVAITEDISMPPTLIMAIATYKNCTGLLRINKNWEKTYNYGITATECYLNCTSIRYVDGVAGGYDDVITAWGGTGFNKETTGIYVINTTLVGSTTIVISTFANSTILGTLTDWGDGTTDNESSHTYAGHGVYTIRTKRLWGGLGTTPNGSSLSLVEIRQLPYGNSLYNYGFRHCANLTYADLGNLSGYEINSSYMFSGCSKLTAVYVNNLTLKGSAVNTFEQCSSLTSLDCSNINVDNVTVMQGMFYKCTSLSNLDLSSWIVDKVTTTQGLFSGCDSLTELNLSNWVLSECTAVNSMFEKCSNLEIIHGLDVLFSYNNKVTNMGQLFYNCTKLTLLDLSSWNTSEVTNMNGMFKGCTYLREVIGLNIWDTSKVTSRGGMFNTSGIVSLDVSNWDFTASGYPDFISYSPNINYVKIQAQGSLWTLLHQSNKDIQTILLENKVPTEASFHDYTFNVFGGQSNVDCTLLLKNVIITNCTNIAGLSQRKLTIESLISIINSLKDLSSEAGKTLYIGSTNIAKLTPSQILVATNKNWTVV